MQTKRKKWVSSENKKTIDRTSSGQKTVNTIKGLCSKRDDHELKLRKEKKY